MGAAGVWQHSSLLDTFESIKERSAKLRSGECSNAPDLSVRDLSIRAADAVRYGALFHIVSAVLLAKKTREPYHCLHRTLLLGGVEPGGGGG